MVGICDDSPYVRLCSLYTMTFYFTLRVLRQNVYCHIGGAMVEWDHEVGEILGRAPSLVYPKKNEI